MTPLVSIIIPVYNGSDYLRTCIDSALAQTHPAIEVIVVNDGSNDEGRTAAIAKSYGKRIRYVEKENGGVSSALNRGIEEMTGDYFSWLSHDDVYAPTKVERQLDVMRQQNLSANQTIVVTGTAFIDEKGEAIRRVRRKVKGFYPSQAMFRHLLLSSTLNGCALLIPRQAFAHRRFSLEDRFIQDWICWVELTLDGFDFYVMDEPLVYSRIHGEQQTKKIAHRATMESDRYLKRLLQDVEFRDNGEELTSIILKHTFKENATDVRERYLETRDVSRYFGPIEYRVLRWNGIVFSNLLSLYRGMTNLIYR
ncbi:glycosyltransferase family 2 protein [Exiguobacterium qingdaonense]|uniref:glycosyltransferase family 2 protein n=1 Tax=Exiguobacterium qingdaonense TaxID=2751251 RepID=UPI001BE93A6B|nr:glycosyltransferase [Exiguobacterium qingdaonense]